MAAEFLRSHGIDLDTEMAQIQDESSKTGDSQGSRSAKTLSGFRDVSLPHTAANSRWGVSTADGSITGIAQHDPKTTSEVPQIEGRGALLAPSLCHPHVHIDKAFLLSHPKYAHLQIEKGDFEEAMSLTGTAKKDFEEWDLLERGQRLVDESVRAGVTHMRAFVEVDAIVGMKCLDAGIRLKQKAEQEGKCILQLCAFAQLPLFTSTDGDRDGEIIRELMETAAHRPEVDVVGSTPYVEADRRKMEQNIEWMIDLSMKSGTHLDLHLDYHLDPQVEPMVWYVLQLLHEKDWNRETKAKTVVLGHCTRLTLFTKEEWKRLKEEVGDLPVSFVGLPTSDMFMMRAPDRTRGTLDVPMLIKDFGLNACIGINNIGNAFTPYGSCDPLTLAYNGVGIYQAGTKADAELLYECVSSRARQAIGIASPSKDDDDGAHLQMKARDEASFVLFGSEKEDWRTRRSISEVVYLYDHMRHRSTYLKGRCTHRGD